MRNSWATLGGNRIEHALEDEYFADPYYPSMALTLKDMSTCTELIGHGQLRSFVDDDGHFWLEQNAAKKTKWAKLARDGHHVAWEFSERGGSYTGRLLMDGEIYTPLQATKKFLNAMANQALGPPHAKT